MFIEVADLEELRASKKKLVHINEDKILLLYSSGVVNALNAICPHKFGPLDEGEVHDQEITCPLHCFMFNIKTGKCLNFPNYSVKTYKVVVENEKVKIEI